MVRTTSARRQTYDVVSNRAVEVDRAIGLRARIHKPRNIPLGVNVNEVHLKVMLIAKRMKPVLVSLTASKPAIRKDCFFFSWDPLLFSSLLAPSKLTWLCRSEERRVGK